MTGPVMPPIIITCIRSHEPSHEGRKRSSPRTQKEVKMIGKQNPSEAIHLSLKNQFSQSVFKKLIIFFIEKDLPSLDSSSDDMLKDTRGIQAGFSWHMGYLPYSPEKEKNNFRNVPFPQTVKTGVQDSR
jgi:hypothetical protein